LFWFAPAAHAEVGWEDNYRIKRWPTSYSACLDGEALPRIGALKRSNPTLQYRYRSLNVQEYLPDEEALCQFVIERSLGSRWVTVQVGQYTNFAYGSNDPCPQGSTDASGYCMPKSAGPPCPPCNGSNPINSGTGNKYQEDEDYAGAAQFPLALRRYYNSLSRENGPLGLNWRHHYQRRIVTLTVTSDLPSRARLEREDGKRYEFNRVSGVWVADGDVSYRLANTATTPAGWTVTTDDDEVEAYDSEGMLLSITRRNGQRHTLTYEVPSESIGARLLRVTDQDGRTLQFSYDASNRIASVALPATGESVMYAYDTTSRLATVTYPDAATRSYQYNEAAYVGASRPTALTGITDENGARFAYFYYDAQGRATRSEHAGGADRVIIAYGTGASRTITDALGTTRTFGYATFAATRSVPTGISAFCDHCGSQVASFLNYDANANVVLSRDFKNVETIYAYDTTRNLETSRTEANGSAVQRTTTTAWHPTYRLPAQVDEPNRRTTFTFDAAGNILTETVADLTTTPNATRVWTYTYDATGKMLTRDGPRTDALDVTTYTYYNCTTGNECGQLQTTTNALGQTTTYNTYDAHGRPTRITDPNGTVSVLAYDHRQRLTSLTVGADTTTYEYWPTGLLKKLTMPDGSFVLTTYDNAHRQTKFADGQGNRIEYTLDGLGNVTAENLYDASGALARSGSQVFNSLNQLWKVMGAAGTAAVTTVYGYDSNGNPESVTAPMGRSATFAFDELDRLKQITEPATGLTKFGYDSRDNVVSIRDARGIESTYTYDGLDALKQQSSPNAGAANHSYDADGNITGSTDARNKAAVYQYDAFGRPTEIRYPDQTIALTYDTGTNGLGRLTGMSDASASLAWTYDPQGRVTGKGQTVGAMTKAVGYGYTNGNRTALITPSGQTINYAYDNGQIVSISVNGSPLLSSVLYDPFGPARGWTWSNGTLAVRQYDLDGKPSNIDSAGAFTYSYDDAFRITGIQDLSRPANSWTFGYDLADRLTSAVSSARSIGYTYDASGNRTAQTGDQAATYDVSASSNRLVGISGAAARSYTYDETGNVTAYNGLTFAYTDSGRLKSVTRDGATTAYVINPVGQRVQKTGPAGTRYFVYDERGHLLGEYDNVGALIQETVWMDDTPVATLRPNGGAISVFYVHTDHLDTPRRVSRPSDNAIVWRWDSAPFGESAANEDPDADGSAFAYSLRFPGQYYDAESGLHYNIERDYDPASGRYVESDPLGQSGGLNIFGYADSLPTLLFDPFGLAPAEA
jgi:RHS repeat-associated protein